MSFNIDKSDLNAYFCLREGTRKEYLTAAPDGRVVRWAPEGPGGTPSERQRWFVSVYAVRDDSTQTVKETRYRIQNVATRGFLHLGMQGTFGWYWCTVDGGVGEADCTFAFELTSRSWPDANSAGPVRTYVNIREFSKGEYLSIGGNGWAVRWGRTGEDGQCFFLEQHSKIVMPDLPAASAIAASVDHIPGPPELKSLDDIPANSPEVLVGEEILPSAVIHDHRYSDPLTQAQSSPFYKVQHYQCYGLPEEGGASSLTLSGQTIAEIHSQFRTLFRKQELDTLEETFMWQVTGEVTGSFGAQKGAENARKQGSGAAKLAFTVGKSVTRLKSNIQDYEKETIYSHNFRFDGKGRDVRLAIFVLLDRYVLTDSQGGLVSTWRAFDNSSVIMKSFPKVQQPEAAAAGPA